MVNATINGAQQSSFLSLRHAAWTSRFDRVGERIISASPKDQGGNCWWFLKPPTPTPMLAAAVAALKTFAWIAKVMSEDIPSEEESL